MTEREALKLALEALDYIRNCETDVVSQTKYGQAAEAIKEALAQPEPVTWPCVIAEADFSGNTITLTMQCTDYKVSAGKHWLSNTPPQRTWVGLTDEEIEFIYADTGYNDIQMFARAIEAKLKQKNGYDS